MSGGEVARWGNQARRASSRQHFEPSELIILFTSLLSSLACSSHCPKRDALLFQRSAPSVDHRYCLIAESRSPPMSEAKAIRKHSAQHDLFNRLHSVASDVRFVRTVATDWYGGRFDVVGK
jgi:hypothetical protein